jgi:abhydrolase domain-containing protein 17
MGNALLSLLFQPPETSHIYPAFRKGIRIPKQNGDRISANFLDFGYEYTILFSHGNAEDIKLLSPWFEKYICDPLKVNVMLYDYSGYGMSDGECSEENVYQDIEAVYLFLRNELKLSPQNIIL